MHTIILFRHLTVCRIGIVFLSLILERKYFLLFGEKIHIFPCYNNNEGRLFLFPKHKCLKREERWSMASNHFFINISQGLRYGRYV